MDEPEKDAAIAGWVMVGLAALVADDGRAADEAFRHAVHLCADAGRVAREIVRQSGGELS